MSYLVSQSKTFFTNKAKNRVLGRYAPAGCGIMVNVSNLFRNAQFLQLPGGLSAQPKAKLLGVALLVGYVKVDSIFANYGRPSDSPFGAENMRQRTGGSG